LVSNWLLITNGVIIQWGAIFTSQSAKDKISGYFTFPIAMNPVSIIATGNDYSDIISLRNWSSTGFEYCIYDRLPQYYAFIAFSWLAIGF
jgi:hypothetical protein